MGTWLCDHCHHHLAYIHPRWNLIELLHLPPELNHVWSAVEYTDVATELVTQVKYQRHYCYTKVMAEIITEQLGNKLLTEKFDAFIPIPLSPSRQRWRGFNQARKLCCELSRCLPIPTQSRILLRQGKNTSQVSKNLQDRHSFGQQFYLRSPVNVKGKHFCLVDDVITTGTTLKEASQVLQQAGATTQCLTFAASISGKI